MKYINKSLTRAIYNDQMNIKKILTIAVRLMKFIQFIKEIRLIIKYCLKMLSFLCSCKEGNEI